LDSGGKPATRQDDEAQAQYLFTDSYRSFIKPRYAPAKNSRSGHTRNIIG
jgi:hypothetical protein